MLRHENMQQWPLYPLEESSQAYLLDIGRKLSGGLWEEKNIVLTEVGTPTPMPSSL
jgi:hypothetical protein